MSLGGVTKLLAGSDGHSYPEMHWRGIRPWREALGRVLAGEVGAGRLDEAEVEPIGRDILARNATRLYRLRAEGGPPGVSAPRSGRRPPREASARPEQRRRDEVEVGEANAVDRQRIEGLGEPADGVRRSVDRLGPLVTKDHQVQEADGVVLAFAAVSALAALAIGAAARLSSNVR